MLENRISLTVENDNNSSCTSAKFKPLNTDIYYLPAQQKFDDLVDYSRQQIAEMPLQVVGILELCSKNMAEMKEVGKH